MIYLCRAWNAIFLLLPSSSIASIVEFLVLIQCALSFSYLISLLFIWWPGLRLLMSHLTWMPWERSKKKQFYFHLCSVILLIYLYAVTAIVVAHNSIVFCMTVPLQMIHNDRFKCARSSSDETAQSILPMQLKWISIFYRIFPRQCISLLVQHRPTRCTALLFVFALSMGDTLFRLMHLKRFITFVVFSIDFDIWSKYWSRNLLKHILCTALVTT